LSLHFLPVAVIPTLAFGLIAISLLQKHLQDGTCERNRLLFRDIAAASDQFLAEVERDLAMATTFAAMANAEAFNLDSQLNTGDSSVLLKRQRALGADVG